MKFKLDPLAPNGISAVTTVINASSSSSVETQAAVTLAGEDYLSLSGQQITANAIDLDNLSATGTPDSSTFLRGDNTWATPAGAGDMDAATYDPQNIADDAFARANHTGEQAISTITNLQTSLDGKVDENSAITGATKTKITYDAKGLVTAGADATTADIADSADKRYVTDAQLTVIGNTSGTNTGDQDLTDYQLKPAEGAFVDGDKTKLDGIETGAEVNNISDANATDLTDGGTTTLHSHTVTKSDVGLGNVDNTSDATKQAATLLAAYPVGSIYINTSNTNPGTFLGGTWAAFGAGRVPVGFDSGQTEFDTDEETGGSKTQASNVTVATQPTFTVDSHTHPLSDAGGAKVFADTSASRLRTNATGPTTSWTNTTNTTIAHTASAASVTNSAGLIGATDATSGTATTRTADVALTNNAVNNLQPYITVRMWKRTA